MAGVLGFEHHVIEGFWSRWSDAEIKELWLRNKQKVSLWFWKHSKICATNSRAMSFCSAPRSGHRGAKSIFFDHEAKRSRGPVPTLSKEARIFAFSSIFSMAPINRRWNPQPAQRAHREAVKGMEASKLPTAASTTPPCLYTPARRPAEYTPLVFGPRRANTLIAIKSPVPRSSARVADLRIEPSNMIASPCFDMIKASRRPG